MPMDGVRVADTAEGEARAQTINTGARGTSKQRATVHRDGGVEVDAADFGEGRRTRPLHKAKRADELGGLASRRRTEQLNVGGRRAVARREDGLVACEGVIADAIETPAMALEPSLRTCSAHVEEAARAT